MKKVLFLLIGILMGTGLATAQSNQVSGVVYSEADGLPVIGASVMTLDETEKPLGVGAATDIEGRFEIHNVPESATHIRVSYVGMATETLRILRGKTMKIILVEDGQELDEVMVVAFGTAKKSAFTGSAKVVAAETIENTQVTSVTNALAGKVAGVQLTSSNGAPGSDQDITIRGITSINVVSKPLIIVDGAPYSGDMDNLNPNDVESMTVLKDAASNALYGARGANGVIVITTKRADKKGDATVTFDAKWGVNQQALQQYDIVTSPAQYYELHYAALRDYHMGKGLSENAAWIKANELLCGSTDGGLGYNVYTVPQGQMLVGLNGKLNPNATLGRVVNYKGEDYLLTPDDWSNVGTRNGMRQEYNASVSAANDKASFYASMGYLQNEGITYGSDMERLTARLKADYQAKKWLKVGGNMSYTNFEFNTLSYNGSSTSQGNVWAFTSQMAPIYPAYIRNADGSVKVDANGISMMDYGNGTNAGYVRAFIKDANPILDNQLNTQQAEGNALTASGFANFTPVKGLTLTLNVTTNLDEKRGTYVYNPFYGQFDTTGGTVSKYHSRSWDYNFQQLANYSFAIAKNNHFDVMVGHEYYRAESKYLSASKSNMFSQDNKELGGAVVDGQNAYSSASMYNNEGYIARLQYDYDDRIFASASVRRDASSRFHPDHRWGEFWSVGAAWRIGEESFLDNAEWIDELKVKASIGSMGNDNIGDFLYTDLFYITNSGGEIGTSFGGKGTEDITWETNTNFNVGVEFGFLGRIYGGLEYYRRKTTDMLFEFSVAPSLGYPSYYDNIGDMTNSGFELELGASIFKEKNFTWDVNFNISTLSNNIDLLHPDKKTSSLYTANGEEYKGYNKGNFFISEDLSMFTWRLKEYAGVDADGQSLWYKSIYENVQVPVFDENGAPVLDAEGNQVMQDKLDENNNVIKEFAGRETTTDWSTADYYVTEETSLSDFFGGFGTSIAAYGFDFSINCSYQIGGKQYDGTYAQFMSSPTDATRGYNYHSDLLNSWSANNAESNIPRFMYNDTYSAASSTRFLTDASYLNIDNINVGYTFPQRWTRKFAVSSLRVFFSADNVFYWSKRQGFDPRQSYSATTDASNYSPMRTLSGGVTIKF